MCDQGYASGSFGPTTAGRMDSYVDQFQAAGGSMIMLAKGNRSKQVCVCVGVCVCACVLVCGWGWGACDCACVLC